MDTETDNSESEAAPCFLCSRITAIDQVGAHGLFPVDTGNNRRDDRNYTPELGQNWRSTAEGIMSAMEWLTAALVVITAIYAYLTHKMASSPLRLVKGSTASVPAGGLKGLAREAAAAASVAAGALRRTK